MKKTIWLVVLVVCLVWIGGCATGKMVGKLPQISNEGFATVHIARKDGMSGCWKRSIIQINNKNFYWLACGERISFKVPVGEEIKISQVMVLMSDHIYLEPEKGKNYYELSKAGEELMNKRFIEIKAKYPDQLMQWLYYVGM